MCVHMYVCCAYKHNYTAVISDFLLMISRISLKTVGVFQNNPVDMVHMIVLMCWRRARQRAASTLYGWLTRVGRWIFSAIWTPMEEDGW